MPSISPRLDRDAIAKQIAVLSREPFRDMLAMILANHPSPEEIRAFAAKAPDRWGQLVQVFNKSAGYNDGPAGQGGETNIYLQLNVMSDSQLRHEFDAAMRAMAAAGLDLPALAGQTIDVIPEPE